ncbi:MAG: LD-carboxypeptidase [Alphaproteobacteria bacterium]|nr:LD-carboxypeptidase [Alphaproteobacteria bacterium]
MSVFPKKLKKGSHIRVIAPSRSFKLISEETREIALQRFAEMGITVSYSKNADEMNGFMSSSIESRISDLHEAFADPSVDAILTAIGGFNSNALLDSIDYELIKKNPKILCGFSDITALCNAIHAKTGLVTYSGTHFSSFGMLKGFDYSLEYFKKCFFSEDSYEVVASKEWSDEAWFMEQNKRTFIENEGHWLLNEGKETLVEGTIIGGNLCTFNLLQGTDYMANLEGNILFIEDNFMTKMDLLEFDRNLTSLLQQKTLQNLQAVVIGRFQKGSEVTQTKLQEVIKAKKKLQNLTVIANVDFGHTTPIITFPIGGKAKLEKKNGSYHLFVIAH